MIYVNPRHLQRIVLAFVVAALIAAVLLYLGAPHHGTRVVHVDDLSDAEVAALLAQGATSDPTDHCECLYVPVREG